MRGAVGRWIHLISCLNFATSILLKSVSTSSDILSSRSHRILLYPLVCKMEGDHQGYSRTIPTRQDMISITFIRHICLDFDIATITIHNPFFRRYVKRSWNEVFIRRLKWLNLKQIRCYSLLFFTADASSCHQGIKSLDRGFSATEEQRPGTRDTRAVRLKC